MSAINDFAKKQNEYSERMEKAVAGLSEDVLYLKKLIDELQHSPGDVTPEDQLLLNQLEARAKETVTNLEALDNLTPPKPPVA